MRGEFKLGEGVALEDLVAVARGRRRVVFPASARAKVSVARRAVERATAGGEPVYGVNTGFGELASRRIPAAATRTLQVNLVRSHASGVGPPLSPESSRAVVFLRANELARGRSGCRPELVDRLAVLLNRDVMPVIPSRGSVGASGDLAPQAHAALLLLGEGKAWLWNRSGGRLSRARVVSGRRGLEAAGLRPLELAAKEGLSLINGTQAMQAVGALALADARHVLDAADLAGAMSLEALKGTPVPFEQAVVALKPHPGQLETGRRLRRLLAGSEIRESHRHGDDRVQDPYSLRCMPQVHGAVRDSLEHLRRVLETEMASVTDNPVWTGGALTSGGNFHGMALALAMDYAAAAMTVLGNISERRVFQLISGQGLPPFLADDPGVQSGYMIPQVVAAALASENKISAHPASADSIPTSANKEDFVSMGMGAALKLDKIVENVAQIAAIELLAAAQGVELHAPLKPGLGVARGLKTLRARAPRARGDAVLAPLLERVKCMVLGGSFAEAG